MSEQLNLITKEYFEEQKVGLKTLDNGEIFSTYSGDTANKALGKACSAFGENNIAGCYGFKVIGFVKGSGSTNAKVTLNTDDTHFDNIVVGDLVSVRINYNKTGLSVVAVDKTTKTVTVSNSLEGFPNYKASDNDYLWLVEKPLAGDTSIGIGAFAGGFSGNHANQDGSLAFGRNNIADGRWSVALGSGNKAGYNTFVYGKDNLALLGEVTAVIGQNNKFDTYTSKSLIIGQGNTTTGGYTINTIVNGQNNTTLSANNCLLSGSGLKSTRQHQTIIGLYNELSNAMFIVGKGNSDTTRVNAFEVYEDGHAEVQTQGTTDDSVVQYSKNSLNGLLNKLDAGTSTPQDGDYFISQYVGGGTTNTTYCRRPVSALYNYIKGKADTTVTASSTNLVTSKAVDTAINNKITSVYKAKGSIPSISDLPVPSKDTESFVYNIESGFTTTDKFVEGVGKTYPAGTNVVIINVSGSTYQYDVLAGMVDLSNYATKTDLSGKLDKVTTTATLNRVYAINKDGTQSTQSMSTGADNSSIALRTNTGTLRVTTPTDNNDAATKKYVDDIVGDINTILSTLVTVTSTQSDEPVSDENVLNDETTVSEEPTI